MHGASIIQDMSASILERLRTDLAGLRSAGLYKGERVIAGPQGGVIRTGAFDVQVR